MSRQTKDGVPWVHQLAKYFETSYNEIKNTGQDHGILSLDRDKLWVDFIKNYDDSYAELSERMPEPDRHKIIALLTRSFLDAKPFITDEKKMKEVFVKGVEVLRRIAYPNSVFATDICKIILSEYGMSLGEENAFRFRFPDRVYIHTERRVQSDYEFELFLLYRHYITRKSKQKAQFSIYQMAHTYFLLEMGAEIAHSKNSGLYYD